MVLPILLLHALYALMDQYFEKKERKKKFTEKKLRKKKSQLFKDLEKEM